jgi:hypothetical protein
MKNEHRWKHKTTGLCGVIAWITATEVGIDVPGMTWTGSLREFKKQWRLSSQ